MKIGILTQPLQTNYGGVLQAWALQKKITDMGHEAIIINRVNTHPNRSFKYKLIARIKAALRSIQGKSVRYLPVTDQLRELSEKNIIAFKKQQFQCISPDIKSNEELIHFVKNIKFDAYVVGSDQVWRPRYSPNLMTYFLDFVKENREVKKIAYAASLGVDKWEYSRNETTEAKILAQLFNSISVRELSGVNLIRQYLNCHAEHVVDPTMLLEKEDYTKLINNPMCSIYPSEGELFCYVLDKSSKTQRIIQTASRSTSLKPFFCAPRCLYTQIEVNSNINTCIVPSIEQWIKSFMDAKLIITDSFHGIVFSIIFNKPFWAIENSQRGTARIRSVLSLFELENRIIRNIKETEWFSPIDWKSINFRKQSYSQKSYRFLKNSIEANNS